MVLTEQNPEIPKSRFLRPWYMALILTIIVGSLVVFYGIMEANYPKVSNNATLAVEIGVGLIVALFVHRTSKKTEEKNDSFLKELKHQQEEFFEIESGPRLKFDQVIFGVGYPMINGFKPGIIRDIFDKRNEVKDFDDLHIGIKFANEGKSTAHVEKIDFEIFIKIEDKLERVGPISFNRKITLDGNQKSYYHELFPIDESITEKILKVPTFALHASATYRSINGEEYTSKWSNHFNPSELSVE